MFFNLKARKPLELLGASLIGTPKIILVSLRADIRVQDVLLSNCTRATKGTLLIRSSANKSSQVDRVVGYSLLIPFKHGLMHLGRNINCRVPIHRFDRRTTSIINIISKVSVSRLSK